MREGCGPNSGVQYQYIQLSTDIVAQTAVLAYLQKNIKLLTSRQEERLNKILGTILEEGEIESLRIQNATQYFMKAIDYQK